MIFSFGKGQKLSDVVKVAEFLEKNGIEYQMMSDLALKVGPSPITSTTPEEAKDPTLDYVSKEEAEKRRRDLGFEPIKAVSSDPMWRLATHNDCKGDVSCKAVQHYGATPL